PDLVELILQHYNDTFALPHISAGAKAAVVGKIRTDGKYIVTYQDEIIVDANASDVTKGILYDRPYVAAKKIFNEPDLPDHTDNYNAVLLQLLAHANIASRAPIY